ncbi:hypothetical protein HOLleu_08904 [Holothuria leucospilota]|uniref:Uncharacterized protein n=1 Tax=Holothuria leucospilota TaxID=206669 RepID=A0A9Q1HGN0_HOLLE|nr:hypothetical protein HOLleu_08904 [Holothuria leucospilota]
MHLQYHGHMCSCSWYDARIFKGTWVAVSYDIYSDDFLHHIHTTGSVCSKGNLP